MSGSWRSPLTNGSGLLCTASWAEARPGSRHPRAERIQSPDGDRRIGHRGKNRSITSRANAASIALPRIRIQCPPDRPDVIVVAQHGRKNAALHSLLADGFVLRGRCGIDEGVRLHHRFQTFRAKIVFAIECQSGTSLLGEANISIGSPQFC